MSKDKERMECPCCGQAVKGKRQKRAMRFEVKLNTAEVLMQRMSDMIERRVATLREADERDPEGAAELRRRVAQHVAGEERRTRTSPPWQMMPGGEKLVQPVKSTKEVQAESRKQKNREYARKYYQEHKATIDQRQRDRKARARANARQQVKSGNGGKSVH